jgi:hypothetical protein
MDPIATLIAAILAVVTMCCALAAGDEDTEVPVSVMAVELPTVPVMPPLAVLRCEPHTEVALE